MGLDTAELIQRLELHFAIRIPDKEAAQCNTVTQVYEMTLRHLPADVHPQKIYADVIKIIAEQAGYEVQKTEPHQSLTDDLGLD